MSWSISQMICVAGATLCSVITTELGVSIKNEINEALGTTYQKCFGRNRRVIWARHARLFPGSRKRIGVAVSVIGMFALSLASIYR